MSLPPLDPQLTAALRLSREIEALAASNPTQAAGGPPPAAAARRWWNEGGPVMAELLDIRIPVESRVLDATVYVPRKVERPMPACIYLHGGGFRTGSPRSADRMLRELASHWGGLVISLDYVHMPEHVFPQAVEDTAEAYEWVRHNAATLNADPESLGFGGSSSGASIALGAAIQLGERASMFKAAALFVGNFGPYFDTPSMLQFGHVLEPSRTGAMQTFKTYVREPHTLDDPRVSCARADLQWMPPAYLAAAELDVFRDSSRELRQALARHGKPCELIEYAGMTHLFLTYSRIVDRARQCLVDAAAFLSRELPAA